MDVATFRGYFEWLHKMTSDFVNAVPVDRWEYTPDPPVPGRAQPGHRLGAGFAPFNKQLRHVICARGVYNEALVSRVVDFARKREYYDGPLAREALTAALAEKQSQFLARLETVDPVPPVFIGSSEFSFDVFVCEVFQHEAIHHGQWSVYASLGGWETPSSWRTSWHF